MSPSRTEPRTERSAERFLLNTIALAILTLGAIMGIVYLTLWDRASEDLSRLLPASTRTYAQTTNPRAGIIRAMTLDGWRSPSALANAITTSGLFSPEGSPPTDRPTAPGSRPCLACGTTELAGVPVDIARDLLRTMAGLEVALVPVGDATALMVFVEVRDPPQRKRLLARIRPHLEAVDREMGFRIDRFRPHPWSTLTGQSPEPPRFVDMEPWFILSWGAPQALEDLLAARVEGRHDAIHRRPGFKGPAAGFFETDLVRVVVDARSAWQIFSGDASLRPGGLLEYLDLMTLTSHMSGDRDQFELVAEISDRELAESLARSFATSTRELLGQIPADSPMAVSTRGNDLPSLLEATRGLVFRLHRDFGTSATTETLDDAPVESWSLRELTNLLAKAASDLPRVPAELAAFMLPPASTSSPSQLVVAIRADDPLTLELAFAEAIPRRLGDAYAHGEVSHLDQRVYVERPHGDGDTLVWRRRGDLIELSSSLDALDRFANATSTLQTSGLLDRAMKGLTTTSALMLFARLDDLTPLSPLARLLASRLTEDFVFGVSLDTTPERLVLRSNLGIWTLASALASATPDELDDITLAALPARCREAYEAFCAFHPAAHPCRPLALGRVQRILAVCNGLGRGP